ncbi:MAG: hypothetical protein E7479_07215 [Ruminococcaceae bacterium]|nr:hypothetical protein [Oscillospiraceae bacterium]
MKKTLAVLIALVLVLSLAVNAVAAGSQSIVLGNAKFTEKDEVKTIAIEAENFDNLSVVQVVVSYDSAKVELLDVIEEGENQGIVEGAAGDLFTGATVSSPVPGIVIFVWENSEAFSGSGVLAEFRFKALSENVGTIKLSDAEYEGEDTYVCRDDANKIPRRIEIDVVEAASYIVGDVDGDGFSTSMDASFVLQKVAGMDVDISEEAADVDGDGFVTSMDASYILQYVANIITEFPVGNNG